MTNRLSPSHVVVDTRDGNVFRADSSGQLFNFDRATAFADGRNAECKPGHQPAQCKPESRTYQVFILVQAQHEWPPRKTCSCGEAWAGEPGHEDN